MYVDEVGVIHDAPTTGAWHDASVDAAHLQAQIDALPATLLSRRKGATVRTSPPSPNVITTITSVTADAIKHHKRRWSL